MTTTQTTTLAEDAAWLRQLKLTASELDADTKKAKAEAGAAELAFFARMEAEDVGSIKYDGTLFVPTSTTYGQVQDREVFVEWALENAPELVEYKERPKLISELIRTALDAGEELPPGLGFYCKDYVSQRVG